MKLNTGISISQTFYHVNISVQIHISKIQVRIEFILYIYDTKLFMFKKAIHITARRTKGILFH